MEPKLMVGLFVAATLFAAGFVAGWLPTHNSFVAYKSQVEQAGRDQAAQAKAVDERNRKLAEEKRNEYQTNLSRNTALWTKRLQNYSSCTMSPNATAASGVAETTTDNVFDTPRLILDCQATTVLLISLQDWAKGIR